MVKPLVSLIKCVSKLNIFWSFSIFRDFQVKFLAFIFLLHYISVCHCVFIYLFNLLCDNLVCYSTTTRCPLSPGSLRWWTIPSANHRSEQKPLCHGAAGERDPTRLQRLAFIRRLHPAAWNVNLGLIRSDAIQLHSSTKYVTKQLCNVSREKCNHCTKPAVD